MRRLLRSSVVVVVLVAGACNRGDDPTVSGGGTTSSSAGGTETTAAAEGSTSTTTTFVPTALPATGAASTTRAHLAAVRVAAHDGYDRVVFEFQDAVPGYRVEVTQRPVTQDGSGDEVAVKGEVVYEVRFENAATARFEGERVVPVYSGAKRITTRGEVVEEVVSVGDFEGVVTWVIGARPRPEGVRVTTLTGPFRVVVDLGSPR